MMPQSNTLKLLLFNRTGALHRTLTLLRRLRYNVIALNVGPSEVADCSEMIVVTDTEISAVTVRRLERLLDVFDVRFWSPAPSQPMFAEAGLRNSNTSGNSSQFRAQADGAHCNEAA